MAMKKTDEKKIGHIHQGWGALESRETLLKTKTGALEVSELAEVKTQVSVQEIANKSREKRAESTVQNNSEHPKDRGRPKHRGGSQ